MSTSTDFPSNCSTNAYLLQDFGELVYIVCTVANPPSSTGSSPPISEDTKYARLKNTESQFRQAAILAVTDPDTSQLYTFYKKVDVMREQKTLLKRFGNVLRSNSCAIAYKSAIRAPEMFKPEHAKIYRLFVFAILSSIRIQPCDGCEVVRLGARYHMIEIDRVIPPATATRNDHLLVRTDIQILHTGHVLLVVVKNDLSLLPLSRLDTRPPGLVPVVLSPGGHVAIFQNRASRSDHPLLPPDSAYPTGERRSMIETKMTEWIQNALGIDVSSTGTAWVDLLLPVFEVEMDDTSDKNSPKIPGHTPRKISYKPLLWPSHMCFTRPSGPELDHLDTNADGDALQFVLDWMQSKGERGEGLEQQAKDIVQDIDTIPFSDEGLFDNMDGYSGFGALAFPPNLTVYPTPPDVVMTHATPGVSSADGFAATPATNSRALADARQPLSSLDTAVSEPTTAAGIGGGFYDEDLFDEMPGDALDVGMDGVEPNWDFFDKPDINADAQEKMDIASSEGPVTITLPKGDPGESIANHQPLSHGTETEASKNLMETSNASVEANHDNHMNIALVEKEKDSPVKSSSQNINASHMMTTTDQLALHRRPIASNFIDHASFTSSFDGKYSRNGEFWFDATSTSQNRPMFRDGSAWIHRAPSISSESTTDSNSTNGDPIVEPEHDAQSPGPIRASNKPAWHNYEPPVVRSYVLEDKIDESAVEVEIKGVIDLLKTGLNTPFLEEIFKATRSRNGQIGLPADLALMFPHLFVDQYSQASLIHSSYAPNKTICDLRDNDIPSLDFDHMTCTGQRATVAKLNELVPSNSTRQPSERVIMLPENLILIRRTERPLVAASTIIPFWDTLGLQPYLHTKDLTAFCFHRSRPGQSDGCLHFLSRIADAYESCALGSHANGQLPGLTDNGIVSLGSDSTPTVRNFVEALLSTTTLTGTVLVYVVATADDPQSYASCCKFFLGLFDRYKRGARARESAHELVLQIIPASFLVSADAIVVPPQRNYNHLAFEVYGRIPPDSAAFPGTCDYPLILADPGGTTNVKFSLESSVKSPVSEHNDVLHLAYALSEDLRWLTAAWTDIYGRKALTMTYQLRAKTMSKGRPKEEILRELWEVSRDLMKNRRTGWRLVVARIGFYDTVDLNGWTRFLNGEIKASACELCLLAIEVHPSLKLGAPELEAKIGHGSNQNQQVLYSTPASTPQATNATSPENLVSATPTPGNTSALNAPTPPEHTFDTSFDSDLSLVDPVEESWAVILPFGINQSHSILDIRRAPASGYLIKRTDPRDEDGTTMMGVHLIQAQILATAAASGQREELLSDIIQQYRGLATLASARGCIDKRRQVLPWHIHTSHTGAKALGLLL
ncbi:hypothetical protein DV736_g1251, partial [Chaetothyriales sp. CBS 134916]